MTPRCARILTLVPKPLIRQSVHFRVIVVARARPLQKRGHPTRSFCYCRALRNVRRVTVFQEQKTFVCLHLLQNKKNAPINVRWFLVCKRVDEGGVDKFRF